MLSHETSQSSSPILSAAKVSNLFSDFDSGRDGSRKKCWGGVRSKNLKIKDISAFTKRDVRIVLDKLEFFR